MCIALCTVLLWLLSSRQFALDSFNIPFASSSGHIPDPLLTVPSCRNAEFVPRSHRTWHLKAPGIKRFWIDTAFPQARIVSSRALSQRCRCRYLAELIQSVVGSWVGEKHFCLKVRFFKRFRYAGALSWHAEMYFSSDLSWNSSQTIKDLELVRFLYIWCWF